MTYRTLPLLLNDALVERFHKFFQIFATLPYLQVFSRLYEPKLNFQIFWKIICENHTLHTIFQAIWPNTGNLERIYIYVNKRLHLRQIYTKLFVSSSSESIHFTKLVFATFYQLFIFLSNGSPSKTMKNVHLKRWQMDKWANAQKDKWRWNNLMSWIVLHKFADVIFGITQKPLYIMSSNLVR